MVKYIQNTQDIDDIEIIAEDRLIKLINKL